MPASPNYSITIDSSAATALLANLRGATQARAAIHRVAANAVVIQLRRWFFDRNARSSTSQYWSHAAESTSFTANESGATITTKQPGVLWHRFGGTIRAKPGKALAIPLNKEDHGIWPSEKYPDKSGAFIWHSPKTNQAFLAESTDDQIRLVYILLKSVSKSPDASVLPSEDEMRATANAAVSALLQRTIQRNSQP